MSEYKHILLRHRDIPDIDQLDVYHQTGGFQAYRKALTAMTAADVSTEVKNSGLRGRGGAGFPTGTKWSFLPNNIWPHYVVCNADESEPGTFKDREIMESNPLQFLEGVMIAAYGVQANAAYIYLRGEFWQVARKLDQHIKELEAAGYLGDKIFGTDYSLRLYTHLGAGAYICGEETALLESLEGKLGQPRLRPPFPAIYGLYGKPTVINNVETLTNLPPIIEKGAEWYKSFGTDRSPGVKIFSLSGRVNRPGNYELPLGSTFRDLIYTYGGGVPDDRPVKAILPAGASSAIIKCDDKVLDTPMDYESVGQIGSALGSASVIVVDDTVNMDWLVEQGTVFTHAHIPGGTSGAVCMPSRAMVNTGRTLFHITGAGETIDSGHVTMGECFRKAGYRTFGAGKWHNGRESFHRSFGEGAEIFFGGMADHWNVPVYNFDPTGRYDKQCLFVENPFASNQTKARTCDHIHAGRHSTDIIADAAIRFIDGYEGGAPFFAYTAFLAPHDPRTMPAKYLAMYKPDELPLPDNFMTEHPFNNGELRVRDELLASFPRTPVEVRRHLAEYYAMISHLDDRMGDIVAAVRRKGLLDNTIFVMAGDNGLALGQHGLFGKQSLYEHSTRVPLIFAGPGIPRGERRDSLAYLFDILPTLCELSGLEKPGTVEGTSLVPAMRENTLVREALYLAYRDMHRGVRTQRHKLIEYVVEGRHVMTQLFDLAADPAETRNLASDPAQAGTLQALRRELFRLRDAWDDGVSGWGKTFWKGYGHE